MKRTLCLIKPDLFTRKDESEEAISILKKHFNIDHQKTFKFTKEMAEEFYIEHKERPFFPGLVQSIANEEVIGLILSKDDNVISDLRTLLGATDPAKAEEGTLRKKFGISLDEGNSFHGSDSEISAEREIKIVFPELF